jgi:hypothetical protein
MWLDDRPDYPLVFLVVLRFAGPIDPATMADAWRFAIARHPLLRATIRSEANRLFWYAPATGWPEIIVAARRGDGGTELRGIDLEREPGLRGSLRETVEGSDLELLFHHACCDGHGARMFLQDLALAYIVLSGASSDEDPFFRSDAALLDDRGSYPSAAGVSLWQRLKRFLRFTVLATAGNTQPCIDELEVFDTDGKNVARTAVPTASSTLSGFDIHRLEQSEREPQLVHILHRVPDVDSEPIALLPC